MIGDRVLVPGEELYIVEECTHDDLSVDCEPVAVFGTFVEALNFALREMGKDVLRYVFISCNEVVRYIPNKYDVVELRIKRVRTGINYGKLWW